MVQLKHVVKDECNEITHLWGGGQRISLLKRGLAYLFQLH